MPENYKGKILNVPGDPSGWGPLENSLFKAIIDDIELLKAGGTENFLSLSDVDPSSYTGQAGKSVIVNATENGITFGTSSGSYVLKTGDTMSGELGLSGATWKDKFSGVWKALSMGVGSSTFYGDDGCGQCFNAYFNNGWKYLNDGPAMQFIMDKTTKQIVLRIADTGGKDTAITWSTGGFTITANGGFITEFDAVNGNHVLNKRTAEGIFVSDIVAGQNTTVSRIGGVVTVNASSPTTAGLLQTVWFTADEITTALDTFYLTGVTKGTAAEGIISATCPDNSGWIYMDRDFLGGATVDGGTFPAGTYFLEFTARADATSDTDRLYKYRIEVYLCDTDGNPIDSPDLSQPVGDLGVRMLGYGDSAVLDLTQDTNTQVPISAVIPSKFTMLPTQRIRYHWAAQKIGTFGGDVTLNVLSGTNHYTHLDTPIPVTLQLVMENGSSTNMEYIADATDLNPEDRVFSIRNNDTVLMSLRGSGKGLFLSADIFDLGAGNARVVNTFEAEGRSFFGTTTDHGATLNVDGYASGNDFLFDTGEDRDMDGEYIVAGTHNGSDYYTYVSGATTYYWYTGVINTVRFFFIDTILRTPDNAFTNALYVSEPGALSPDDKAYIGQLTEAGFVGSGTDISGLTLGISTDTIVVRDNILVPDSLVDAEALNNRTADTKYEPLGTLHDTRYVRKDISDSKVGSLGTNSDASYTLWNNPSTIKPSILDRSQSLYTYSTLPYCYWGNNLYYTTTGYKYRYDGFASYIAQDGVNGRLFVFVAPYGTADSAMTSVTEALRIVASGALESNYLATAGNHLLNRDAGDARYSQLSHTHDDRYYTESESDTRYVRKDISDSKVGALGTNSDTSYTLWGAPSVVRPSILDRSLSLYAHSTQALSYWTNNAYYTTEGYRYRYNAASTTIAQNNSGEVIFYTSPSGTAGDVAALTERLKLTNSGALESNYLATAGNHLLNRDAGDARYSQLGHRHDDRYYTESESDSRYEPLGTLHDTRYVRKDVSDSKVGSLGTNSDTSYTLWNNPSVVKPSILDRSLSLYTHSTLALSYWTNNAYYTTAGYRYRYDAASTTIAQNNSGEVIFYTSPSGTAGELATLTERLKLTNSGALESNYLATAGNHLLNRDAGDARYLQLSSPSHTFVSGSSYISIDSVSATINCYGDTYDHTTYRPDGINFTSGGSSFTMTKEEESPGMVLLGQPDLVSSMTGDGIVVGKHLGLYYTAVESDNTFSSLGHNHDDRYYTETESNARYSQLGHNHDDRYYTESECDSRFAPAVPSSVVAISKSSGITDVTGLAYISYVRSGNVVYLRGTCAVASAVDGIQIGTISTVADRPSTPKEIAVTAGYQTGGPAIPAGIRILTDGRIYLHFYSSVFNLTRVSLDGASFLMM